jgi:hypothetical protein
VANNFGVYSMGFTKVEIDNLQVLIDAGARSIAAQTPLDKAGEILKAASDLAVKVKTLTEET